MSKLIKAVRMGHIQQTFDCLWAGADVNALGEGYKTALHWAAEMGRVNIIKLLLIAGAKVDVKNHIVPPAAAGFSTERHYEAADVYPGMYGSTPLQLAVYNGHIDAVNALLEKGASTTETDGYDLNALHIAAAIGHTAVVQKLLTVPGADIHQECRGWTALHWAASSNSQDTIYALCAQGLEVNKADCYSVTALHRAAYFGRVPVIEALLNVGADINLADSEGMTPLHKAAENGHAAAVKYLLSRGADIHAKNILGMTPLQCAIEKGRKEIVEILKAAANKHDKTTHAGRLVAASPSATAALDLLKLKEPQQFNSAMVSTVKRSGESVVGVKRSRSELHAETASTKVDYSAGPSV